MRILVTGGAGFIGSHLCERLLREGNQVVCLDNFCDFYNPELKRKNIQDAIRDSNFHLVSGDLLDRAWLERLVLKSETDLVVHLAAMAGVRPSIENPGLYAEVNITGTMNLLEASRQAGIKRVVFASSSSVYGDNPKTPFAESDPVDHPISPYAATKKAGELICHTYHHLFGMSILCLRFFTVYGPRQRPDLAIHKFARRILAGQPIPVFGDGSTRRDYTYIDDILDGVTKAIDHVQRKNVYDIFNLGESRTIRLDEMICVIEDALGVKAIREVHPAQPGDVEITYADISKSRQILGYNPQMAFTDGVGRFVEWMRQN
jgi:UDP-glucuronate 4-epimerase